VLRIGRGHEEKKKESVAMKRVLKLPSAFPSEIKPRTLGWGII
jgi:hypothetical protein